MTFHIEALEHGFILTLLRNGVTRTQWCPSVDDALALVRREFAE